MHSSAAPMEVAAGRVRWGRLLKDRLATAAAVAAVVIVLLPLAAIFVYLLLPDVRAAFLGGRPPDEPT